MLFYQMKVYLMTILAANSLPNPSGNGKTSDNALPVPSVNGKSSGKTADVSVPETSTFTSGMQSVCVPGDRLLHIPAMQHHGRGVRTRGHPARDSGRGVGTFGGAVTARCGAARARGRGAHNINRNTVSRNSSDGEFLNPKFQKVFIEHPGPIKAISSAEKRRDIFMPLLKNNVLQIICHETNRYHQQNTRNDNSWKDITPTEMTAFFGIKIAMGMVRLPEISNYWKRSGVMEVSWFQSIFTRKRFYDILN